MLASTPFQRIMRIFLQVSCLFTIQSSALAVEQLDVDVAPYSIRQVSEGLAELMCRQLSNTGLFSARTVMPGAIENSVQNFSSAQRSEQHNPVDSDARYQLSLEILYFDITTKDNALELGRKFNDLSRLLGGTDELAECRLHVQLRDMQTGIVLLDDEYSGRESRHGVRLGHLSAPRLREMNYLGAQFQESNLGLATYKALGDFLHDLYNNLPMEGRVLALQGDTAIVSLGDGQLVAVGDELSVLRVQSVRDSSGKVVWDESLKLATLRVLELRSDRCLCLILDGTLGIAEGDTVRPAVLRWTFPDEADHQAQRELLY
jgi:hypothetical protein